MQCNQCKGSGKYKDVDECAVCKGSGVLENPTQEQSMNLIDVSKDVLTILSKGHYHVKDYGKCDIGLVSDMSTYKSIIISSEELRIMYSNLKNLDSLYTNRKNKIEITEESSQQAAKRLGFGSTILNFASATTPGGGFLKGMIAQEEDLCRSSSLYPALSKHEDYYDRIYHETLYHDNMIWSPGVIFFKESGYGDLCAPYIASVITSPAPNAKKYVGEKNVFEFFVHHRIKKILTLAKSKHTEHIILGAWGCGIFGNNPIAIAESFKYWLERPEFNSCFSTVVFPMYNGNFKKEFEGVFYE